MLHYNLVLSWLAIASTVTTTATTSFAGNSPAETRKSLLAKEDFNAEDLYNNPEIDTSLDGYEPEAAVARDVRDALADAAMDVMHEYGQGVDVSLEGYDHDLVARNLEEEGGGPLEKVERGLLGFEGASGRLGPMKPRYVVHGARDEDDDAEGGDGDDEEDEGPWVDLNSVSAKNVGKRDADDEDDYDEGDGLGDDGDTPLVTLERDTDSDGASSPSARDVEDGDFDASDEIDYSLEGYDHSLLDRDSEYEYYDADDVFHGGAYDTGNSEGRSGRIEERDADEPRVVQKGPPVQSRRELDDETLEEEEDGDSVSNAWSTVRRWIDDMMYG